MKLKRKTFILNAMIFVAIAVTFHEHREPTYKGRTLREWLTEFDPDKDTEISSSAMQVQAVRYFGTNGLPILVEEFTSKDSALELRLMKLDDLAEKRVGQKLFDIRPAENRRVAAFGALLWLGRDAAPISLELSRYLSDSELASFVAIILSGMGEPGRAPLLLHASSTNWTTRMSCARALQSYPRDEDALLAVQTLCQDPVPNVRQAAAMSLGQMGAKPEVAVPILVAMLEDSDANVRFASSRMLRKMEKVAPSSLTRLTNDTPRFAPATGRRIFGP